MKHRIFAYFVIAAATFLFIPSASATWGSFHSMGATKVVGQPSCAQLGSGEVMCVGQSQRRALMANQSVKGKWSGWTNHPGAKNILP